MLMTKVWIVNLITGVICMGIVSGCAVKNVKIEKVNKEMKESKEEHALDKSQSQNSSSDIETPSWIDEEMIDEKDVFNSSQKTQPLKNKPNLFSNPNVSGSLKKENERELFLADNLEDIFFGLDQYNIDKSANEILIKHAEWLKKNPLLKVQLAGHCDERGTNNYNIALGTRRALNVRKQLAFMGISLDRLLPISYGEEKPSCRESTEECWSKNRRVRFLISSN